MAKILIDVERWTMNLLRVISHQYVIMLSGFCEVTN